MPAPAALAALVSAALVLLALVALGLCLLTLWRHVRALGRDLSAAGGALGRDAPAPSGPAADAPAPSGPAADAPAGPGAPGGPQRQARGHMSDD